MTGEPQGQTPWAPPAEPAGPPLSWGTPPQSGPVNAPSQPWQDAPRDTPPQSWQNTPFNTSPQGTPPGAPPQPQQEDRPPTAAPVEPDAPSWQPPPAFTAAAAGMQVWPSPGQDPNDASRWPAASGEPVWTEGAENETPQGAIADDESTVRVRKSDQAPLPVRRGRAQDNSGSPAPGPDAAPQPPVQGREQEAPGLEGPPPVGNAAPDQAPVPLGADAPGVIDRTSAPPPEQGDHPTPPRGIPVVTAPLAAPAGNPPPGRPSAPRPPAEVERGPFTPPSAVVQEIPPLPTAPPRKRVNTVLLAAVVAVVVGGTGTGAFFAYQSFNARRSASAETPAPTAPPVEPTDDPNAPPEPDPIKTEILNSEKTDPGKMTVADAFTKKVTLAGATFVRVKTEVTDKCDEAAAGRFANTLATQDCRQVLRATYVDSKRKYAVTTGIAVLPTLQSAVEVDRTKNLGSNLWFRGLPGGSGSGAERVGIAGGYAAGLVWGRYIVFSYATFSDGHTPTAKEKHLGKVSGAFRDETAKVIERRITS
ncbi:hypothetical protein [Streptosporangium jomthongense]|uniref:Uncharacterized protein n=1 Tax=Streptosporangium jomthongense TaxID=1193683 RepID=A0ABV8F8T7_9ACTN